MKHGMTDQNLQPQDELPEHSAPKGPSAAGGVFIALFTLVGTIAGGFMGQPSIGLLGGLALGIAIAITIWLKDRAR